MAHGDFHVFISAVTSEFGRARDELARDLRTRGMRVQVQSDFRDEGKNQTLLGAIHDYIEIWHNTRRRHSALNMLTPTEYETQHQQQQIAA